MPARRPFWCARLSTLPALIAAALVLLTAWPATAQREYRVDPNKRQVAAILALGRAVELNQEAAGHLTMAATAEDISQAIKLLEAAYGQATIAATEVVGFLSK